MIFAANTYDTTYIKMYYPKNETKRIEDDLRLTIKIIAIIHECTFTSVKFSRPAISISYVIGRVDETVGIPDLVLQPECDFTPNISGHDLVVMDTLLEGVVLEEILLLDLNTWTITVPSSEDFGLIGSNLSANLTLNWEDSSLSSQSILINVAYITKGPEFLRSDDPKPITCSESDSNWSFLLPEIVLFSK